MWRLWTRGWGPRYWWHWFKFEAFPMWVAKRLPRRIALWAFILVTAASGTTPDEGYKIAYNYWTEKYKLNF